MLPTGHMPPLPLPAPAPYAPPLRPQSDSNEAQLRLAVSQGFSARQGLPAQRAPVRQGCPGQGVPGQDCQVQGCSGEPAGGASNRGTMPTLLMAQGQVQAFSTRLGSSMETLASDKLAWQAAQSQGISTGAGFHRAAGPQQLGGHSAAADKLPRTYVTQDQRAHHAAQDQVAAARAAATAALRAPSAAPQRPQPFVERAHSGAKGTQEPVKAAAADERLDRVEGTGAHAAGAALGAALVAERSGCPGLGPGSGPAQGPAPPLVALAAAAARRAREASQLRPRTPLVGAGGETMGPPGSSAAANQGFSSADRPTAALRARSDEASLPSLVAALLKH